MDQTTEIRNELRKALEAINEARALGAQEVEEILTELEAGIILDMTTNLLDRLSDEGQHLLEDEHFESYEDLIAFLKKTSSPESFEEAANKATVSTLNDFFARVKA